MKYRSSTGLACYPGRLTTIATLIVLCIARIGSARAVTAIDAGKTTTVNGTVWNVSDGLYVNGALNIINGGLVNSDPRSFVGFNGAATGAVSGVGSTWESGSLTVGGKNGGEGSLTISDGASVNSTTVTLGSEAGSVGIVTVTGAGSIWNGNSEARIGLSGEGRLTISDGASVNNSASDLVGSVIGYNVGSHGTVEVTGAGSRWNSGEGLLVGLLGEGSLSISNGATVSTSGTIGHIGIGQFAGSVGSVTVTGVGSSLNGGEILTVGGDGEGYLSISDGAVLNIGSVDVAFSAGSLGELAVGGRAGEDAVAAGVIDTPRITFGVGTGALTLNHTSTDFMLAADISGTGTVNALSGVSTLSGDNSAYQGNFNIDAPATLVISEQKNISTSDIAMTGGTLAIDAAQDWQFSNDLNGNGTLSVDTDGNRFDFASSSLASTFSGVLALKDTLFSLAGTNTNALQNTLLRLGSGSVATAGDGQQTIDGLAFDGGTLVMGTITPGQTTTGNTLHTTGTLDISGQGTVQITTSGSVGDDVPTPDNTIPLLEQDEGNILVQLASGDSVSGSGGNLTLTDQNGNTISNGGVISDITLNGSTVARGTYDYRLTGGDSSDGLYVSYALTRVDLLGLGSDALVLASEGRTGSAADLSAKLTGSGDLAIETGEGNTVSLSNLENDYTGTTDIRSGTLLMGNDNVLGNTALLQMAQGTGLEMNGHRQSVGSVDIANEALVNLADGSLVINQGGQIDGELTGSGSLALNGGTLDVDGANDLLSAAVTIAESATVNLNAVQGLGTGSLELAGQVNVTDAEGVMVNSLSNDGTLALHASQVQLAGDNSDFNGIFTIDADSNLSASAATHLGNAAVQNDGLLTLTTNENWLLANHITGNGSLLKEGTGTVALGTDSTLYTGTTDILQGGLTFGAGDNSATLASSQVNIHEEGFLAGNGTVSGNVSNQGILQVGAPVAESAALQTLMSTLAVGMDMLTINGSLTNGGLVQLTRTSGVVLPGNQLIVNGDYTGNDGRLVFSTTLSDDASATDYMAVTGNTSGTTRVNVTNAGGTGAQTLEGIELINVGGRSDGNFIQDGRIVAGAYDYSLVRGEGSAQNNWYLTSMTETVEPGIPGEPEKPGAPNGEAQLRPEVGSYLANNQAANTLFMTRLHDRPGETQYTDILTGERKITSMWMRNVGGHTRFKDGSGQIGTQSNRYVLQIGSDLAQWSTAGMDRWHLGVMGGYANSQSRSESNLTGYTSRGQVNGYSAGLYGTWYANDADKSGTYVDTWMLYNWFDNTVSGQEQVTEKYKSRGVTASVEAGYSLKLAQGERDSYWLQPKAQLVWMDVQADDHREQNGTQVKDDTGGNLMTRLGIRGYINGHNAIDDDNDRAFQPFVEINWIHNTHSTSVAVNDVSNEMRGAKNIGEMKVGVEGQITSRLNLWGNVAQQVGDKGYSDTQGMLGIKYMF